MKNQIIFRTTSWLLALGFASVLALSGCKSESEPPPKSDQPQKEHPQKEHPEHPKPADTNK